MGLSYDPVANKLFALGGDASGGGFFDFTSEVDELNLTTWPAGTWVISPPALPSARQANQAGFYGGGKIWSTGGYNGAALNDHLSRTNGVSACATATSTPVAATATATSTATSTTTATATLCPPSGLNIASPEHPVVVVGGVKVPAQVAMASPLLLAQSQRAEQALDWFYNQPCQACSTICDTVRPVQQRCYRRRYCLSGLRDSKRCLRLSTS